MGGGANTGGGYGGEGRGSKGMGATSLLGARLGGRLELGKHRLLERKKQRFLLPLVGQPALCQRSLEILALELAHALASLYALLLAQAAGRLDAAKQLDVPLQRLHLQRGLRVRVNPGGRRRDPMAALRASRYTYICVYLYLYTHRYTTYVCLCMCISG